MLLLSKKAANKKETETQQQQHQHQQKMKERDGTVILNNDPEILNALLPLL